MSQAEDPLRTARQDAGKVTVEDVRELVGPSTPHFALQLRNRIEHLVSELPEDHPARIEGERQIARLQELGVSGETRGQHGEARLPPMPSVKQ
jgi:hypothetical protein